MQMEKALAFTFIPYASPRTHKREVCVSSDVEFMEAVFQQAFDACNINATMVDHALEAEVIVADSSSLALHAGGESVHIVPSGLQVEVMRG